MRQASRRLWCVLPLLARCRARSQPLTRQLRARTFRLQRKERTFNFEFPDCDKLPPPVLPFVGVSFSYNGKKEDYLCARVVSADLSHPFPATSAR